MKKLLYFMPMLIGLLSISKADAQTVENDEIRDWSGELGYFQKAHRDQSDPRFMFHDGNRGIDFGIGGTAQMASFYALRGMSRDYDFKPGMISIPTEPAHCFATHIGGSEVHFKSRAWWNGHKVISYLKLGGNPNYSINISQVYVSIDGFSFGKIPSFLNDLEAGVNLRLCGPPQVDLSQPLIGYTYRTEKGIELAAALESASLDMSGYRTSYNATYIDTNLQPTPDLTMHFKYRWGTGHIQAGAALRYMNYWQKDANTLTNADGQTGTELGYCFSLSGNMFSSSKFHMSWSAMYGKGAAKYMAPFAGQNLDLALSDQMDGTYHVMKALPLSCASVSGMYKWNDSMTSSLMASWSHVHKVDGLTNANQTKNQFYAGANLMCNISDFLFWGVEYYYGFKELYYPETSGGSRVIVVGGNTGNDLLQGHAHRAAILIGYIF